MRNPDTTKHDYGHALLVAGAYGRMGCAILAARAALRSGCGLVSVHLPARCVDPLQAAFPEAMVSVDAHAEHFATPPRHPDRYTSVAIGPGLGTHPDSQQALLDTLRLLPGDTPLVLDADALNIMALRPDILEAASHRPLPAVLTPHAGEYRRLFGDEDPVQVARRQGLILVCKAHHTLVCGPDGRQYQNHTGNAGMATAGSGDVLTGVLAGVTAQSHSDLYELTRRAVAIHGQIGDFATRKQSQSSLIASDMVDLLKNIEIDVSGI